ncbi:hypothetical protein ABPG72_013852, partial [Tetrahymena utriculariae]
QNQCNKCTNNCDWCSDSTSCNKCSTGFYKFQDGSCNICDTSKGFYINNQTCLACDPKCKTCNGSDKSQCTSCYIGYILINSECQQEFIIKKSQQPSQIQEYLVQNQQQVNIFQGSSQSVQVSSLALSLLTKQSSSIVLYGIVCLKLSYLILVKTNFPIEVFIPLKNLKDQLPSQQMKSLNIFQKLNENQIEYYDSQFYSANLPYDLIFNSGQEKVKSRTIQNISLKENTAIIYQAYQDDYQKYIWRYSQLDQNGNITQTYLIKNMDDLQTSYYFIENQFLYFFTNYASKYQLIDLSLLTTNQQNYLQKLKFSNKKGYTCNSPMVRKYQTYDIFLSDNKLCKANMSGKNFSCSKIYDFGVDIDIKSYIYVIISKVFVSNGANLIFGFDYKKKQYVFFDVLTLNVVQTIGNIMLATNNPLDIFQYQNYVFIQTNLYQVTYGSSPVQVSIKLITSYLSSNYYYSANYPFYNLNFQFGETIYLAKGQDFFILNVSTLFPQKSPNCTLNCFICSSLNVNECQICNQGFVLNQQECIQIQCISNCSQCIDQSTCQVCKSGYFLQFNWTCETSCPSSAQKDNNSKCICDPNSNLVNGQCICNQQYYQLQNECFQCSSNCDFCLSATNCNQCSTGYYLLQDGSCNICNTENGYFKSNNQCLSCQKNCLICTNQSTCTKNIECGSRFTYDNNQQKCVQCLWDFQINQCVDKCNSNQFNDQVQNTCSQCYYQNNTCLQQCPQGFYADSSFECQACHKSCMSCKGPLQNQCLRCFQQYFLQDDLTCQICENGYFLDSIYNQCVKCDSGCATCNGPLSNNCLSCKSNFILQQSTNLCLTQSQILSQDQYNQKLIYANCDLISSDCTNLSTLSDLIQKLFLGLFVMTQVLLFMFFCTSSSNLLGWYYIQIVQLIGNLALNKNMNVFWFNIGFLKNLGHIDRFQPIQYWNSYFRFLQKFYLKCLLPGGWISDYAFYDFIYAYDKKIIKTDKQNILIFINQCNYQILYDSIQYTFTLLILTYKSSKFN